MLLFFKKMLDERPTECLASSSTPSVSLADALHFSQPSSAHESRSPRSLSCRSSPQRCTESHSEPTAAFRLGQPALRTGSRISLRISARTNCNQSAQLAAGHCATSTKQRSATYLSAPPFDRFIDSSKSTAGCHVQIHAWRPGASPLYGRLDFGIFAIVRNQQTAMNNATTVSPFSLSALPGAGLTLNSSNDDFLIINLTDGNSDKPELSALDLLVADAHNASQAADYAELFGLLNSTDLADAFNYTNNQTENQGIAPVITIHHPWLALFLACICIFIVLGNLLIIVAVRKSRQLRQQTTNYFVISLAFSDTLVGLIVMPFSIVQEVLEGVWVFGQWGCDLWHSFDVLGTTSSILSLCVISIDRYYAITKPFDYAVKMTPKKAKLLILLIFAVSSLLSFPAILWWRSVSTYKEYECTFPVSTGYIVFSSTLSFYGPLVVMVVMYYKEKSIYYKIYRAAVEQTRSLKTGAKTISYTSNIYHAGSAASNLGHFDNGQFNAKSATGDYPDQMITLRMHRGGNYNDSISSKCNSNLKIENSRRTAKQKKLPFSSLAKSKGRSSTSLDRLASVFCNARQEQTPGGESIASGPGAEFNLNNEDNLSKTTQEGESEKKQDSFEGQVTAGKHQPNNAWSISRKVSKLAKERKAAKTLGIVMGVFILCWAPFFITHIVMGICASACDINKEIVYSIVTWLGWLNSLMNPIIYACWSRDFRKAFRKVLCGFRDSSQRTSTGYSSYYFSSKFNAPAPSLARKRPMIGDRHFGNKLSSLKQPSLNPPSSRASRDRTIETINELDDNCNGNKPSSKRPINKILRNVAKPSESKSSPDLTSLSNVVKESDEDDSVITQTNGLTNLPSRTDQQSLMGIEKQSPLIDGRTRQLDASGDNRPTRSGQSSNLVGSLTRNLNSQALSNVRERSSESMKSAKMKEGDSRTSPRADKIRRKSEIKDKLNSLGNWFRTRDDRVREDSEENSRESGRKHHKEDKKTNNDMLRKEQRSVGLEEAENDRTKVDTIRATSKGSFGKADVDIAVDEQRSDKDDRRTIGSNQAKDNFGSIHQKVDASVDGNRVSEQYRLDGDYGRAQQNDQREEEELGTLVVHGQDASINGKSNEEDEKKNGRLTSPYCTYKITAECTSSSIDSRKLSDADQFKEEEEFTIKIQLSEPR